MQDHEREEFKALVKEALTEWHKERPPFDYDAHLDEAERIIYNTKEVNEMNEHGAVTSAVSEALKAFWEKAEDKRTREFASLIPKFYFVQSFGAFATKESQKTNIHYNTNRAMFTKGLLGIKDPWMFVASTYATSRWNPFGSPEPVASLKDTASLPGANGRFLQAEDVEAIPYNLMDILKRFKEGVGVAVGWVEPGPINYGAAGG